MLKKNKQVHIIGIGGIGMSGIARILSQKNYKVSGSDENEKNEMLDRLEAEGIKIYKSHDEKIIDKSMYVIYGSAIKENNVEYKKAKEQKIELFHRAEVLEFLMKDFENTLLVTGSHGKTTTTALLTHVLIQAKENPSFLIGGIFINENVNAKKGVDDKYLVIEADESDGSFLKMKGIGGIVTNIDSEHLDFWKSFDNLKSSFDNFLKNNILNKNLLFWCYDNCILRNLSNFGYSYGFSNGSDLLISNYKKDKEYSIFTIKFEGKIYKNIKIKSIGKHNVLNAAATFGLCIKLKISSNIIRFAFENFLGVRRRFEKIASKNNVLFFDDYAHHPTEIQNMLIAIKNHFIEKRLIVLFQPHKYSRFLGLLKEFEKSFNNADLLIITDVYNPVETSQNIDLNIIAKQIEKSSNTKVIYIKKDDVEKDMAKYIKPHDIVISLGAGDSNYLLKKIINKKINKIKLGLIFGGKSKEHAISIISATNILNKLDLNIYDVSLFYIDKKGKWFNVKKISEIKKRNNDKIIDASILKKLNAIDVCFPVLHGPFGEDGSIQGMLSCLNIPYIGCDYHACAISMNKAFSKKVISSKKIKTARFYDFTKNEWIKDKKNIVEKILKTLSFPVYIKPVHLGSSIGIEKVEKAEEKKIIESIESSFNFDSHVLVEENVEGQELEFAIKGVDNIEVSTAGEIIKNAKDDFYSFDKKYGEDSFKTKIPANISSRHIEKGKKLAIDVYTKLGCTGLARVDFFLDKRKNYYFNEINPIPGFSQISLYPQLWEHHNITISKLLDDLIISAMYLHRKLNKMDL